MLIDAQHVTKAFGAFKAVDDASVADDIFTQLMGERVEPRRDFIKSEARKVRNLDI